MKNHLLSVLMTLLFISGSIYSRAQGNLLWNHKSILNAGATAMDNDLQISATGTHHFSSLWGSRVNADFRIKKWNSGFGISFTTNNYGNNYGLYLPELRYSYHLKLGEETVLGLGASFGINTYRNNQASPKTTYHGINNSIGANLKWHNFNFGWSTFVSYGLDYPTTSFFHLATIEYLWKINDKWKIDFSMLSSFQKWQPDVGIKATYNNKYYLGLYTLGSSRGLELGLVLSERVSIGYSVSTMAKFSKTNFTHLTQNLNFKFTIPEWKKNKKSVGL